MKTTRLLASLLLCLAAALLHAQSAKPMVDGTWKIKSLKSGNQMTDMTSKITEVIIDAKGKKITALAGGCNKLNGNFEFITADQIKPIAVSVQSLTRKTCPEEVLSLENTLNEVLSKANYVRKQGNTLEFYKDADLLLVLVKVVDTGKKKKK